MKKLKQNISKLISLSMLLAPVSVMAQLEFPDGTNLPDAPIFEIIRGVMLWLLGILGFIAVIGFVISGIMYLVAAGDEDAQKKAKRAMYYSITGIIVGLVGIVALQAAEGLLNVRDEF